MRFSSTVTQILIMCVAFAVQLDGASAETARSYDKATGKVLRGVADDPKCGTPKLTSSRRGFQTLTERITREVQATDTMMRPTLEPLTRGLYNGFSERVMGQLNNPVDHLHGRCWFDDQLSCSMLESSLHELRGVMESLSPQHLVDPATYSKQSLVVEKRVIELRELATQLNVQCKSLPWHLG